ncbi:hypothetical protein ACFPMF_22945 [Larkinella bovis]|uniref:Uncharacterized protein n=1 Tax=Larkinella bovis TaxID=683041 RepID=A0ABW0IIG1_9BACT
MADALKALLTDKRIEEIRTLTATKDDGVPFLLLPVRIETRFMELDEPSQTVETDATDEILDKLLIVQVDVLDIQNSAQIGGVVSKSLTTLGEVSILLDKLINLTAKNKKILQEMAKSVQETLALVASRFGTAPFAALSTAVSNLITKTNELVVDPKGLLNPARELLDQLQQILSALTVLSSRDKTPFQNLKNKKDLYEFVDKRLQTVADFYANQAATVALIKFIMKNQRTTVVKLHGQITPLPAAVKTNLALVHDDPAWQEFLNGKTGVMDSIAAGIQQFGSESIPVLNTLPEPPQTDFSDLFHQSIKALVNMKRLAISNPAQYQEVTKFKEQIKGSIGFIDRAMGRVALTQTSQFQKLGRLYEQLKPELSNAQTNLTKYQPKNQSQKFGLGSLSKYLTNDATAILDRASNDLAVKAQKAHELWVRIYPDDIFIHTHEEALTEKEFESGQQFWNAWWVASNDLELEKAAWKRLCTTHDTRRASWIASLIDPRKNNTPTNTAQLQNKPFRTFGAVLEVATTLPPALQALNPKKEPLDFWTTVSPNQITVVTERIGKLADALQPLTELPDFLAQKLEILLVRAQGDIDAITTKAQALTSAESQPFTDKINAFATVQNGFGNLISRFNQIVRKTVDQILAERGAAPLEFITPVLKQQSWTAAPHTNVLPERFAVITRKNGQFQHIVVGNKVPAQLPLGLDPALFSEQDGSVYQIDENGDLQMEENLKWMADYGKAVEIGMGITVPLTEQQYNTGFDQLLVVGVKDLDVDASQQALEKLLINHIYAPDGMSFLKVGTPTNNTESGASGYSSRGGDEDERFEIEILNSGFDETVTDPKRIADGQRLADSLGISTAVTQKITNRKHREISNAFAMNRALWHATIGHAMEEMWDHVFAYDNIRRTETFFLNHCPARGVVPSVRVGLQPYGILPTTAYLRLQLHNGIDLSHLPSLSGALPPPALEQAKQVRFDVRFHEILKQFSLEWTKLRQTKVEHYELLEAVSSAGEPTPQQRFIEILGLNPTSVDYFYRYGVNITRTGVYAGQQAQEFDIKETHGSLYMHSRFKELMFPGRFAPSFDFRDESNPGGFGKAFMLLAGKYSRIRDQFEQSRIFRNRFIAGKDELRALEGYLVDKQPISTTNKLEKLAEGTFIDWLLNSSMDKILAGNNPQRFPDPNPSVLFLLMRQALMQAYQEAALDILQMEGLLTEDVRRIVGDEITYSEWKSGGGRKYNTKWHPLLKDVEDVRGYVFNKFTPANPFYKYLFNAAGGQPGRASLSAYINKPDTNPIFNGYPNHVAHRKLLGKVDAVRDALSLLNDLPTKDLSILLAEHIDLCSYRLDAWLTGLVNRRLTEQRAVKKGIHLGAFGWVENLKRKPDEDKKIAKDDEIPDGLRPEGATVYKDPDNDGFIHAPSLNHAITAAVLRGAYRASDAEEDINNRLAVNISSARVRTALNLIDGVKNGLQIGAILGFQFEKGLHERYKTAELDQFILPFRNAFPLVVPVKDSAQADKRPAYNSNVVDGMALLNKIYEAVKWMDFPSKDTLFEVITNPANNTALKWLRDLVFTNSGNNTQFTQIAREIDRMADALDALGDIAISESVFQIVQGNHVRAAAIVSSLSQGRNIPDPQIVETPRSGTIVTQRVLLNLAAQTAFAQPTGWGATATPRAKAEPSLNHWLGMLLGKPDTIRFQIAYQEPDAPATLSEMSLNTLGIQPLDLLFLSGSETDFKQFIGYHFLQNNPVASEKATATVDFRNRAAAWGPEIRTIHELDHLLKQLRIVLLQTQVAGAEHFVTAGAPLNESNPGNHNITQLATRAEQSLKELQQAADKLLTDAFVKELLEAKVILEAPNDTFTEAQFTLLRSFLLTALQYGIANAAPVAIFEHANDLETASSQYFQQTATVYKQVRERIKQANGVLEKLKTSKLDYQRLNVYTDAVRALFGKVFPVLPLYQSPDQAAVATQLNLRAGESLLRHAGPLAMSEWLQSVGRVRPRMTALELIDLSLSAQDQSLNLAPVQLKYNPGDYWLGAEYPDSFKTVEDKLSLVLINPERWSSAASQVQTGLVLDEWIEIIPGKEETTGIVINYDQPDATPPQSMLLAVTPVQTGRWAWEDLVFTLIDTLEMAKNRAVEPDHLDQSPLSHILPFVLSEVVPPQVDQDGDANPLGVQVVMDFAFAQKVTEE